MDSPSLTYAILLQWAAQTPALLAYLVGIVLALIYWPRCPTSSALTLGAMILLGIVALGVPVSSINLPRMQAEHHWTIEQVGFASLVNTVIWTTGRAVGIGLLLGAVFHGRPAAPAASVPPSLPPPLPIL